MLGYGGKGNAGKSSVGFDREDLGQVLSNNGSYTIRNGLLREKIQTCQAPFPLTPETTNNSSVSNYFRYCTGFTYDQFNKLQIFQTTR